MSVAWISPFIVERIGRASVADIAELLALCAAELACRGVWQARQLAEVARDLGATT